MTTQSPIPNEDATEALPPQNPTGDTARASWNFSADAVAGNTAHYTPEARELLRWAFAFCIDPRHPMARDEFSRRVGYSDNVIYKIYTARYRDPNSGELLQVPEKLLSALRTFKAVEMERELMGQKAFVITPTVRGCWELFDLARESQTPAFLFGASQIGKTEALRQYAIRNNHGGTPYVRFGAASGLNGMMRLIAEAVGVSPKTETKKLIERVKKALQPNMLLLLDEVHQLVYTYRRESFFACVEVLREIYDCTKCGIVLSMTNLGRDKFERERRTELEQMFRRGVHRLELGSMPSREDLQAILLAWGLPWPEPRTEIEILGVREKPYAILRQLAREEGLTAIFERLRYSRKIARLAGQALDWPHVVEAHLTLAAKATPPETW